MPVVRPRGRLQLHEYISLALRCAIDEGFGLGNVGFAQIVGGDLVDQLQGGRAVGGDAGLFVDVDFRVVGHRIQNVGAVELRCLE